MQLLLVIVLVIIMVFQFKLKYFICIGAQVVGQQHFKSQEFHSFFNTQLKKSLKTLARRRQGYYEQVIEWLDLQRQETSLLQLKPYQQGQAYLYFFRVFLFLYSFMIAILYDGVLHLSLKQVGPSPVTIGTHNLANIFQKNSNPLPG